MNQTQNTGTEKKKTRKKGKRTGAKIAVAAFSIVALVGLGTLGITQGGNLWKDYQETKRAETLVSTYINTSVEDGYWCILPDEVIVNKAYDIRFCDGAKLVEALNNEDVKYCEIDDTYYTPNGSEIAILTFELVKAETQAASKYEYEDNVVYMPPTGYSIAGSEGLRETVEYRTIIVPKSATGDYSAIGFSDALSCKIVECKEVKSLPYSAITEQTLICDVADNAKLNENNECSAELRVIPKKY